MKPHLLWLAAVLMSEICVATTTPRLPVEGKLPSLDGATAWLNSPPLDSMDLRGKVVLVEFWTYSCINWLRTLPYVRAWADKYKDRGLIVIGVHTPEFGFEKDVENVRRAAKDLNVNFPIATDSSYAIWRAFDNNYWPALYFVDRQGRIRHHQFGEGDYERSELIIQQLLAEGGRGSSDHKTVSVDAYGAEAAADWESLQSPETYVGYGRAERFASRNSGLSDRPRTYSTPQQLSLNQWALSGNWTMKRESAVSNEPNGKITYRFHARDLHLVMAPAMRGARVPFRILIDGQPPGASHGVDVDEEGHGTIVEPRMYQLIRQPTPIVDRHFEIEFLDGGAEAFVFTFG